MPTRIVGLNACLVKRSVLQLMLDASAAAAPAPAACAVGLRACVQVEIKISVYFTDSLGTCIIQHTAHLDLIEH